MARLIPAHAGKTDDRYIQLIKARAHPRSRGENGLHLPAHVRVRGSSPLTRGKPVHVADVLHEGGLIPAHAGKTRHTGYPESMSGAHPRSRGENPAHLRELAWAGGSSPLTRGKPGDGEAHPLRDGLIPAHAGKTFLPSRRTAAYRAHPRSRGENGKADYDALKRWGSSPLTRGKRLGSIPNRPTKRLIPAHAGKTQTGNW